MSCAWESVLAAAVGPHEVIVEPTPLRQAMRRAAGTVCVVAAGRLGRRHGLTATSIASLCMDPPALLVCINRASATHAAISEAQVFSVNLLRADHVDIARAFSSPELKGEARFAQGQWSETPQGNPRLDDANACIVCSVEGGMQYGSHTAYIGRVIDVHLRAAPSSPLIYLDGTYGTLNAPTPARHQAGVSSGSPAK